MRIAECLLLTLALLCSGMMSESCEGGAPRSTEQRVEFLVGDLLKQEGGTWEEKDSPLQRPFGVDFDSTGRMLIVELEGGRVFQRDAAGVLTQISGDGSRSYRGDGGPAAAASYNGMHNVAVLPAGDVLISDSWNHCVRKIEAGTGHLSTIAGTGQKGFSGDNGPATQATFDFLMCITLNASNDMLHVTDLTNRRIRTVDLKSGLVRTVAGNGKKGVPEDGAMAIDSPLVDPRAAAADSKGRLYILERGGHALRVVTPDGRIRTVVGTGKSGFQDGPGRQAQLNSPKHLCVDGSDNVYIADDENGAIRLYNPATDMVTTVLGRGHGDTRIQLLHPHGVCWEKDLLYVVDTSHNRILRLKP